MTSATTETLKSAGVLSICIGSRRCPWFDYCGRKLSLTFFGRDLPQNTNKVTRIQVRGSVPIRERSHRPEWAADDTRRLWCHTQEESVNSEKVNSMDTYQFKIFILIWVTRKREWKQKTNKFQKKSEGPRSPRSLGTWSLGRTSRVRTFKVDRNELVPRLNLRGVYASTWDKKTKMEDFQVCN